MMPEPLWHTRPIPIYSIEWEWQAMAGDKPLGAVRCFFIDALNDLSEKALVKLTGGSYSVFGGNYRVRPVHTYFNVRMGFPY